MTLRPGYIAATLALLVVELLIARFVDDWFIRPYFGDALAVVLVYTGLRGVTRLSVAQAAAAALAIAFLIEFSQLVHVLDYFGLGHNGIAKILFGSRFEIRDLITYVAGILATLAIERLRQRPEPRERP